MFKVKNRNTGTRCEICSKLTIKTTEQINDSVNWSNVQAVLMNSFRRYSFTSELEISIWQITLINSESSILNGCPILDVVLPIAFFKGIYDLTQLCVTFSWALLSFALEFSLPSDHFLTSGQVHFSRPMLPNFRFPHWFWHLYCLAWVWAFSGFGMDLVVPLEAELSPIVACTGIAWGGNMTRGWRQFCVCWKAWTRWISRENISLFWHFCFCKVTPLSMLKIDYCKRIHVVR